MTQKLAINGFGRIGRNILRACVESGRSDVEIVAINDLGPISMAAHLFRNDSVHGRFQGTVEAQDDALVVNGKRIPVTALKNPAELPWGDVDVALECTGVFTDRESAATHLENGCNRVLVSAPTKNADRTVVFGVNHQELTAKDEIVSNASCTTNCLAPVAYALHAAVGIETGYMTTIHSYTGDQPTLDAMHKDPYRARAASVSMIPTSTGAARAVGEVLPELAGRLDGSAIRVPTPNVSAVDLSFTAARDTSVEHINKVLADTAAAGSLRDVLGVTDEPLVSIDYNHDARSSIVALDQTKVLDKRFVRILSWYDNEWGFSNRMLDTAAHIGTLAGSDTKKKQATPA